MFVLALVVSLEDNQCFFFIVFFLFFLSAWTCTISTCFWVLVANTGGRPPLCLKGKLCMVLAASHGLVFSERCQGWLENGTEPHKSLAAVNSQ